MSSARTRRKAAHSFKTFELGAHSGPLRLVAFSDYRVQDVELVIEELSKIDPRPDLILYAGDDIDRFRPLGGKNLFEAIARHARYGLCAVAGNDDKPAIRRLICGKSVFNVHLSPLTLGSYAILGVDGAPSSDFGAIGFILHSEQEIAAHLSSQQKVVASKQIIVLSHAPPEGILDQAVRFSLDEKPRSIGSRALRKFVETRKKVALVVCGHVHRCGGKHKRAYGATVVNAANHDDYKAEARLAIIELGSSGRPKVEWRQIRTVSVVPGVGLDSAERLSALGIRTAEDLADSQPKVVRSAVRCGRSSDMLVARARALVEDRPIIIQAPKLPEDREVFLDIETDLGQSYVWLIGLCLDRDAEYKSFFAQSPGDEKSILLGFLSFMERYPAANILTCSGSRFEERTIRSRLSYYGLPTAVCERMIDIHQTISRTVALPTKSYKVKEIGAFFGYRYKHADLDGSLVASLYENNFRQLRDPQKRRRLALKLLEYNEDDVRCLPFILRAIERLSEGWKSESPFPR